MKPIDLLKTTAELAKNNLVYRLNKQMISMDEESQRILKAVQEKGYYVLPNFFTSDFCTTIIQHIEEVFKDYQSGLWKDALEADVRAFGINKVAPIIEENYYQHPLIKATREAYYQIEDQYIDGFTMANRIKPKPGNLGSGGGWHRDTVNVRQFKAITYLTDVTIKTGAFQYLEGSQSKYSVVEGIMKYDLKHNHNRFTETEIEQYIQTGNYQLQTLTAKAGTLILVDTSGIHRGMPIEEGVRYALTNYYWVSPKKGGKGIPASIKKNLITSNL